MSFKHADKTAVSVILARHNYLQQCLVFLLSSNQLGKPTILLTLWVKNKKMRQRQKRLGCFFIPNIMML
jgi:hypothetical protein